MPNAERGISPKRTHAYEEGAAKKSAQHDAVGDSSNSMPYQSSQSLGKVVKRAHMSYQCPLESNGVLSQTC